MPQRYFTYCELAMSTVKMMIQPRADLERSCYSRSPFRSDCNDAKVGQAFRILTLKLLKGSTSKCQRMNQELGGGCKKA